jgi:hypothetical protein
VSGSVAGAGLPQEGVRFSARRMARLLGSRRPGRRRISLLLNGMRVSSGRRGPFCGFGGAGGGQERGGEHGQGDVPAPGVVAADLLLVEPVRILALAQKRWCSSGLREQDSLA